MRAYTTAQGPIIKLARAHVHTTRPDQTRPRHLDSNKIQVQSRQPLCGKIKMYISNNNNNKFKRNTYLFACKFNNPEASYEVSTSKKKQQQQNTNQGSLYNNNNNN
jgi:hypothetical protein